MKEKVKIWSRRRLLGVFLAFLGLSAVATAQAPWTTAGHNGTASAKCATENAKVLEVTKTAKQMREGTDILLKFTTPSVIGDKFYLVAAAGGALAEVTNCDSYGKNLAVGELGTDGSWSTTDAETAAEGTTIVDGGNKIWVKATNTFTDPTVDHPVVYELGIYIQDVVAYTNGGETVDPTSCYSDVYYIKINVLPNIYASLTLNGGNNFEYICHNGTTQTNLGFSLCHLPAGGTLNYTVTATNATGRATLGNNQLVLNASAGTPVGDGANAILVPGTDKPLSLAIAANNIDNGNYRVKIGNQTIFNNDHTIAGELVYKFENMEYVYTEGEGNSAREVRLPVIFETEADNCNPSLTGVYPDNFTVYVAPNFSVQTLAYGTADDRTNATNATTTFCQGTTAYLNSTTTAIEGTITKWTWSVHNEVTGVNNIEEATAKFTDNTSAPQLVYTPNAADDRVEDRAQVGILSNLTSDLYRYTLVGKWDNDLTGAYDTINGSIGCLATSDINIVVTPAPILLLATDETVKGDDSWNSTNVITAPEVCPGNQIFIKTTPTGDEVLDGTNRDVNMMAGNYIKHNGNDIAWSVTYATGTSAYTDWRNTTAQTSGTIAHNIDNDDVAHYLDNNGGANPANVTYTVQATGTCKLVKSNGMPLSLETQNDGKVQIVYPVSTRPTFQLGNMFN